jgi:hypothetical protein
MLDHCCPGWTKTETDHFWRIDFGAGSYPTLPKGAHGNRKNPEIQAGHVRTMARQFNSYDCAKDFFNW